MYLRLITLAFLAFLLAHPAPARVIYVSQGALGDGSGSDWQNACTTITAGLTVSASGDEIWVKSATYSEAILLKEGVALYGGFVGTETERNQRNWRTSETIIDATGLSTHVVVGADFTTLDGFTLTGGSANNGGGVYCDGVSTGFRNCAITNNRADGNYSQGLGGYGGGVYCSESSSSFINCRISKNTAAGGGGGICLKEGSELTLKNCLISRNHSIYAGSAICFFGPLPPDPTLTLVNCTIADNNRKNRDVIFWITFMSARNCIFWNTDADEWSPSSSLTRIDATHCCIEGGWPGWGNISTDPQFVSAETGDYRLQNGSLCIDRGQVSVAPAFDIDGNPRPGADGKVDIGAYESPDEYEPLPPKILYVRVDAEEGGSGLSWDTAFPSVQGTIHAAFPFDEIWVAAGRYQEALQMSDGASLYGGFQGTEAVREDRDWVANPTIIDATGLNSNTVTCANQTVVDGFTITGGGFGSATYKWYTGGVVCDYKKSATIRNCTIQNNFGSGARISGASCAFVNCTIGANEAAGVIGKHSVFALTSCTIIQNGHTGISASQGSFLTVTSCVIAMNRTGIANSESFGKFLSCTITDNIGEGVHCRIYNFSPGEEGVDCRRFSPILVNCLIASNGTWGIFGWESATPELVNCVIADNAGGGVFSHMDYYFDPEFGYLGCVQLPKLTNCIIWNDNSIEVEWKYHWFEDVPILEIPDKGEGLDMTYSCAMDGWPDVGNTDSNPLFVDPGSGDYHLQPGSPCIDSGSTGGPDLDLDGHVRPVDIPGVGREGPGAYDMGTYEFGSFPPTPTLSPTPTNTPGPPTLTPIPPRLWLLDGYGRVHLLPALTPTPTP